MDFIQIVKKANCYTVEINANYRVEDSEDEEYFYFTKEEMVAALPELVEKAHAKAAAEQAQLAAEKVGRTDTTSS